MSTDFTRNIAQKEIIPESLSREPPKKWHLVAIAVGVLVLGGGAFGVTGLLYSHGLIEVPSWLASAIGTVGNTPHFWSLWVMGGGGIAAGGALLCVGIKQCCSPIDTNVVELSLYDECQKKNIDTKKVIAFIQKGAKITVGQEGKTPLVLLAKNHDEIDFYSLCKECYKNEPELLFAMWNLYFDSVVSPQRSQFKECILFLNEKRMKLNAEQSQKLIAIFCKLPSSSRDVHIFKILLNMVHDPKAQDEEGNTLLHNLCREERMQPDLVNAVIERDSSILDLVNKNGQNYLHLAFLRDTKFYSCLSFVKSASAPHFMQTDNQGFSPFYLALDTYFTLLEENKFSIESDLIFDHAVQIGAYLEDEQQCRILLNRLLNLKKLYVTSPSHFLEKIICSLKKGINVLDDAGKKPLDLIFESSEPPSHYPEILKFCLTHGAQILDLHKTLDNRPDSHLFYALLEKASLEQLKEKNDAGQTLIQRLFDLALNTELKQSELIHRHGKKQWTCCFIAVAFKGMELREKENIIHTLLDYVEKQPQGKEKANLFSMIDILTCVLKPEVVFACDAHQKTPLHRLIAMDALGWCVTKELVKHPQLPINAQDKMGNTFLHLACQNDVGFDSLGYFQSLLEILCQKGASTKIQNSDGNTPLHLYLARSNPILVSCESLLKDAYLIKNKEGLTPLHIWAARGSGHSFVDKGLEFPTLPSNAVAEAAFLEVTQEGNNALHIAVINKNLSVIEVFKKRLPGVFEKCSQAKNHAGFTPFELESQNS